MRSACARGNSFDREAGISLLLKQLICSFQDGDFDFVALRSSPAARLNFWRAYFLSHLHSLMLTISPCRGLTAGKS